MALQAGPYQPATNREAGAACRAEPPRDSPQRLETTPPGWKTAVNPPLIYVLNGPNLNLLGLRQPEIYGATTLDDVEALCAETAEALDLAIDFRQTNGEGELITWIHEARAAAAGIVINPAGYSHTSVAVMDALLASDLPVIEVHITNIHKREAFRHHSFVSGVATGVICGLGPGGYALALRAMAGILAQEEDDA